MTWACARNAPKTLSTRKKAGDSWPHNVHCTTIGGVRLSLGRPSNFQQIRLVNIFLFDGLMPVELFDAGCYSVNAPYPESREYYCLTLSKIKDHSSSESQLNRNYQPNK
jgi:hypothetical protein